jgi:hypothetical protein
LKSWKAPLKLSKSGIAANPNANPKASRYDRSTLGHLPDNEPLSEPVVILFVRWRIKLKHFFAKSAH